LIKYVAIESEELVN